MILIRRLLSIPTIIAVFVLLGLAYAFATPVFEKPDEPWHFAYIQSLAQGRGFPTPPIVRADDSPAQESSQPPLYYLASALVVRLAALDTDDWLDVLQRNPVYPFIAEATRNDNKNVFIHARLTTGGGTSQAVMLARGVAILFGALAVTATFGLARDAFPGRPTVAPIAAAFVAFLPQFLFISSAVSNDSAAVATCALALWAAVRIIRNGLTAKRAAGLGSALALAALSKASAVALTPLSLLAVTASLGMQWRRQVGLLALSAAIVLVVAGPWYARSLAVFGDALGTSTHLAMPWAYTEPLSPSATLAQLPGVVVSFWLAFGWGNVLAPDVVYAALNVLALIGFGFLIINVGLRKRIEGLRERIALALLTVWLFVVLLALLFWVRVLNAPLGRLAFPALPAIGVLLALGWTSVTNFPSRFNRVSALSPAALLALSVVALPAILTPAYAHPTLLAADQIEEMPGNPVDVRYGDVARLVRLDVPRADWPHPGDEPTVKLCWEALTADPRRLLVSVQFVGAENHVIATRRTLPGLGAFPTAVWQPSNRFCDAVRVPLPPDAPAPVVVRVEVAMIDPDTKTRLPAFAPDSSRFAATFIDRMKIAPLSYPEPPIETEMNIHFGDQVALAGYAVKTSTLGPGEAVAFRLFWRALRRPDADYTVFVHLRDGSGETVAQGDGSPQGGAYPTSFWDAGEVVVDDRTVAAPTNAAPGEYTLVIGLYELSSGDRLFTDAATLQTEVTLARITVR